MKTPNNYIRERHFLAKKLSDIILGGQDGLVNVLGLVLGVAGATSDTTVVLIAGLAATVAETISMAAVAYTSTKADRDYYMSERALEEYEVKTIPDMERREIRDIYKKKGFRGQLLNRVVEVITSNKKVWVDTMMSEELNFSPRFEHSPFLSGVVVFISTFIGSLFPLIPFLLFPVHEGIIGSILLSIAVLFIVGVIKARITVGNWLASGLELAAIGTIAALSGYFVGLGLGMLFGTNVIV